jgi:hypothetical protein
MVTHCQASRRSVHLVNLDPAAEHFAHPPTIDIKDLVTLEDVMEELQLGPNGGLVYCIEYLLDNLDWLEEELGEYEDDYLIIDCPGQIELYTHFDYMKRLIQALSQFSFAVCAVHLLDSSFLQDVSKFFSGTLSATSAMMNLGCPHVNVLSKWDLIVKTDQEEYFSTFLEPDGMLLAREMNTVQPRLQKLTGALVQLIDTFGMVSYVPLNIEDESSIEYVLSLVDYSMQYGEDLEPKEPVDVEGEHD